MIYNYSLLEATSESVDHNAIESEFKKKLNTCKLTKFKSNSECLQFYSYFFMNSVDMDVDLKFQDWATIYNDLLSDTTFSNNLCFFIAMYKPAEYRGMFRGLRASLMTEVPDAKTGGHALRYYSNAKASLNMIYRGMTSVCDTVKAQINDQNVMIYCTVIDQTLRDLISYVERQIQKIVADSSSPESIEVRSLPISESVAAIIDEWANSYYNDVMEYNAMNEGIVNTAKEQANALKVKLKRLETDIDQRLMKKWKAIRTEQKNRKHAEIVGEAFRFTNEIKRIMKVAPAALINPMIAVLLWVATVAFDRQTDKKDRQELVDDLKDELEIIEEKIQIADRKGDEKERIELIRIRQKYARELQRITRVQYQKRN